MGAAVVDVLCSEVLFCLLVVELRLKFGPLQPPPRLQGSIHSIAS